MGQILCAISRFVHRHNSDATVFADEKQRCGCWDHVPESMSSPKNDDVIDRDVLYGTQPLRNDGGEVGRLFFRVTSHQRLKTCSHIVAGIVED